MGTKYSQYIMYLIKDFYPEYRKNSYNLLTHIKKWAKYFKQALPKRRYTNVK